MFIWTSQKLRGTWQNYVIQIYRLMIFLRSHYLPGKYLLLLSGQNENSNMCRSQFIRGPSQLPQKLYNMNYVILSGNA